ncbi:DEKNAAC103385 [Brettanomyces naardenensis]|uniref:Protein kinase C-like 1 n=1 Tax=Brettanomyces naardenensis TaxID=13370 RepID=A0A448YNJ0_BRENA|nr:DEKNAAC103385 [Brettanomyces naardenensis]
MTEPNPVIADILRKIERERKIAIGANNLRKETSNATVIQGCNTRIRDSQKNIEYLEETLKKMTLRQQHQQSDGSSESHSEVDEGNPVHKPAFTVLDLLKYECPSLGHRIQYMLQLLQFKMQVEEQYREANEKIYRLYEADGDRRSLSMAQEQRLDSDRRLQLIRKSLKQYQSLYVDVDEVARENAVINTYHKNPLTGMLSLTVTAIRNVDHISSPLMDRNPECTIVIKVDDTTRATTKPVRTDRWNDHFDMEVSHANELSLTIYDKQGDQQIPVAMCWLPLSDISEEIRRKKVSQQRGQQESWISASLLQRNPDSTTPPAASSANLADSLIQPSSSSLGSSSSSQKDSPNLTSSCWFELEPSGQILVTVGFVKSEKASESNAFNGLGRHGAIRQRKEEVTEYHGHKFVQKQFYNIMCCAVCGDFLRYSGFQCEDCRFLCHKKCYKNVITKCISKSSTDNTDSDDETTLNHRIPHRFVQVTNRGTKWCCHCGYILPWGKKNVRKCAECGIMCHASCAHLVPDFCGMSLEKANQILTAIKIAQERKALNDARRQKLLGERQQRSQKIQARQAERIQQAQRIQPVQAERELPQVPEYEKSGHRSEPQTPTQAASQPSAARAEGQKPPAETYPRSAVTAKAVQEGNPSQADQTAAELTTEVSKLSPQHLHHHHKHHHHHRHGLDDFRFIAVLGKGNFGKVMLAESLQTKQLCAIKVLKKDFIIQNDEVESTKSEKRVFMIANRGHNPFLLNLHQCFQTENRIYFVMEYIAGGDLMWHVQQKRFSQKRAQFYAAEVLLALKFLHQNGVIYRDLKLDNILLTADGHIKLADYGLCKENMWYGNKTSTFCGTPELMAPEILKEQGYDKAVDWWAFGVLLYQMLLTKSPFRGEDEDEVFNSILTDEPLYPINMAKEAVDVLQRLLTRDPAKRLGAGTRDAEEIMEHPYFASINWEDIINCKVVPPYVPGISDPREPACFDEEFTSQAAKLTPVNSVLSPSMQEMFRGFTYTNDENPA